MAIINSNICEYPTCPDNTSLRIVAVPSVICSGQSIIVAWVIENNLNIPSQNELHWSQNSQVLTNVANSKTYKSPYYAMFAAPSTTGIMQLKIKATINGIFYESEIYRVSIVDCSGATYVVNAKKCIDVGNKSYIESSLKVWVNLMSIPMIPMAISQESVSNSSGYATVYFKYNGGCYYIDNDSFSNKKTLSDAEGNQSGVYLDKIEALYDSCFNCVYSSLICDFYGDTVVGSNENYNKIYYIGNSESISLTFEWLENDSSMVRIIIINYLTSAILYDSGCISADKNLKLIVNTQKASLIAVNIIQDC